MFFEANVGITLQQSRAIEAPTGMFARMASMLSLRRGEKTTTQEVLAITGVLQGIYEVFRGQGLNNILTLTVDGRWVFRDVKGVENDLEEAIRRLESEDLESFEDIRFLMEDVQEGLHYHVFLRILRVHPPDEPPIMVTVRAIPTVFQRFEGNDWSTVTARVEEIFANPDKHGTYIEEKRNFFEKYVTELVTRLKNALGIEKLERETRAVAVVITRRLHHDDKWEVPNYGPLRGYDKNDLYGAFEWGERFLQNTPDWAVGFDVIDVWGHKLAFEDALRELQQLHDQRQEKTGKARFDAAETISSFRNIVVKRSEEEDGEEDEQAES